MTMRLALMLGLVLTLAACGDSVPVIPFI